MNRQRKIIKKSNLNLVIMAGKRNKIETDPMQDYGGSCIIDTSVNRRRRNECYHRDEFELDSGIFEEREAAAHLNWVDFDF